MANILQLPCNALNRSSCTPAEFAAVEAFRVSMLGALAPLIESPTNGGFLSACVQHCHQNVQSWDGEMIANVTVAGAFDAWWSGAGGVAAVLVDGLMGTNAHCR